MRWFILLAVVSAAFAAQLPTRRSPQRIVGGEDTNIEQYPFMSNVQHLFWGLFWLQWCGGALITSRSVVSAAHCYYDDQRADLYRIRLGSSLASSGGSLHDVARVIVHEQYDEWTISNDVAILTLVTPADLNTLSVVRIAGTNFNLPDGTVTTALGWGTLYSNGPSPEQLQRVDFNLINQEICAARYDELQQQMQAQGLNWPYEVTEGMVCFGILDVGGKDACQGDSGGPVVFDRDILYGITSWGYNCAEPRYPGINVRVSYYSNWIVANGST